MKPTAVQTPDTAPFWQACDSGELLLQRCSSCSTLRYFPRPGCHNCGSLEFSWQKSTAKGTIYTYTSVYRPAHPAFTDVPYTLVVVELEEGVRIMSQLVDCSPEDVRIGMAVGVAWDTSVEPALPYFKPLEAQT